MSSLEAFSAISGFRNARRALERLPDHMLKGIGIGRAEIDAVTARGRKRNQNRTALSSLPLAR